MADKKPKNPEFTSPRGTFVYPKLNEPDYGTDEFPKPDGEYSVRLRMTEAEAEPLLEKLQPLLEAAYEEGRAKFAELPVATRKKLKDITENELFQVEYDKETEEPTGNVLFKFAMKASGKSKKTGKEWSRKPVIFDAKGNKMTKAPAIWGGTVGKVSFEARPYFIVGSGAAGLKLGLNAAQVIDLVSGGGRDAEGYGFGEEDGYEYDDTDAADEGGFKDETAGGDNEEF
ncbi:single-stranded DNA-binding protein [Bordetella phage vB_BbrP_BB8]|uniref:Single-stranded DNA-binding protein n=1 Tax=Bordetella phage vB_BbrP_BB8 TaxID=2587820 RepID=A0A4Y5TNQ0_9CAUD|nr:single-stranded DNA-binding protein [Bordetella phage vB_BbrP_BB8]